VISGTTDCLKTRGNPNRRSSIRCLPTGFLFLRAVRGHYHQETVHVLWPPLFVIFMTPDESERSDQPAQSGQSNGCEQTPTASERDRDHNRDREYRAESETDRERDYDTCPECGGRLEHDPEHGERACAECGLVVNEDEIDHGAEWTAHSAEEQQERSRVGSPVTPTMHDKGLSTEIDWRNQDARGNPLSTRQRRKMQRLRTWHSRSQTDGTQERNLRHGLGEIDRMASALGLPTSIRETASVIYRRVISENLLIGRSVESVSAAALYAATRQSSSARSLDGIVTVARMDKQSIGRTYRYISRELGLEIGPPDPTDHLPRLCSVLDLSTEIEQQSRELLEIAIAAEAISGKNPVGLAAAAVYASGILCKEKVTQSSISEVASVSKVTIRNRYQELLDLHEQTQSRGR
jgi:transcription initiation factor TFIIB